MPIAGIAATAAAVTAFVIIPSMSGSDDSSTDITVAAAAAERAPEESTASDSSADDGSAGADATEEVPLAALSAPPITVVELEEANLVDLLDATAGESSPEAVQDRLNSLGFTKEATVPPDLLAECISDISGQLPPETTDIVLYGVDTSGSTLIAHIGLVFGDGIGAAMSVELDTCSIVIPGN